MYLLTGTLKRVITVTTKALHPSNAGIGSILNIANANDIDAIKARYSKIHISITYFHIATAAAGPANFSPASFALPSNNFPKIIPNHWKVILVSALIS